MPRKPTQTETARLWERIGVLMNINRDLRIEIIKVIHENTKLKYEKIIW